MKTIAIIPARGGSKGVPHKNIKLIAGKPLICYCIESCLDTQKIETVFVSTESEEIKAVVRKYDDVKIINRPHELAEDNNTSEEVLLHAIRIIESDKIEFDAVLFAQATSPLTEPVDFSCLIEKINNGYDSAAFYIEDYGFFFNEDDMLTPRLPRQVRKPRKREVGNGWAFRKEGFLKAGTRLFGNIGLCKIEHHKSMEIDDNYDIYLVERLLLLNERKKRHLYYRTRNVLDNVQFEENYWGAVIDPDGKERNRKEERTQRIADIKEELNYINKLSPGKILDVGCGMGDLLSAVDDRWEKYGLEISKFAATEALKYANIHQGNVENAPYPDEFFDVIVMLHVIEHLKNPEVTITKIRNILKHEGKLIIGTPDFDSALARRFGNNYRLLYDKTHISLFSRISLRYFLEDFGFEIDREEFPFFETRFFSKENLMRLFDTNKISPPFWGNFMTFYCRKK